MAEDCSHDLILVDMVELSKDKYGYYFVSLVLYLHMT